MSGLGTLRWLVTIALGAALSAGGATQRPRADDVTASHDPENWTGFGRTAGEQHFSPLGAINDGNVARLGLAWSLDLPPGNSVSAPVEADGTLYIATGLQRGARDRGNDGPRAVEARSEGARGGGAQAAAGLGHTRPGL